MIQTHFSLNKHTVGSKDINILGVLEWPIPEKFSSISMSAMSLVVNVKGSLTSETCIFCIWLLPVNNLRITATWTLWSSWMMIGSPGKIKSFAKLSTFLGWCRVKHLNWLRYIFWKGIRTVHYAFEHGRFVNKFYINFNLWLFICWCNKITKEFICFFRDFSSLISSVFN